MLLQRLSKAVGYDADPRANRLVRAGLGVGVTGTDQDTQDSTGTCAAAAYASNEGPIPRARQALV